MFDKIHKFFLLAVYNTFVTQMVIIILSQASPSLCKKRISPFFMINAFPKVSETTEMTEGDEN